MAPRTAGDKKFSTRMCIHVNLRRSTDSRVTNVAHLKVYNRSKVPGEPDQVELGPRSVSIEQGFKQVQEIMTELSQKCTDHEGVVKDKYIQIEVPARRAVDRRSLCLPCKIVWLHPAILSVLPYFVRSIIRQYLASTSSTCQDSTQLWAPPRSPSAPRTSRN